MFPKLRIGTHGAWSVTMRSTWNHSLRAAAGSVSCYRLRLAGQLVGVRVAELGLVGVLVIRAAAQDGQEEFRCGGEVGAPSVEPGLNLAVDVADRGEEPAIGHCALVGPVSEVFEHPDEVGAQSPAREVLEDPHGHRHVRGVGIFGQAPGFGHVRAVPDPVFGAGGVGAVAAVAGEVGWEQLAGHRGLARGEVAELEDPGAVDGVADGLPGLEAGERRLSGVEEQKFSRQLQAGVHAGRVTGRERLTVAAVGGGHQVSPSGDNRRFLPGWTGHSVEADDIRVTGRLGGV